MITKPHANLSNPVRSVLFGENSSHLFSYWSFLDRSKINAKLDMCFNNSRACENSFDKTLFTFQIARALAVFSIDEVVIFDESGKTQSNSNGGLKRHSDPNILLARILQYLECPQYLRKNFFPKHADLQYAGM